MRSWSIPAGRLFGVEIRIHLTFFFLLPLCGLRSRRRKSGLRVHADSRWWAFIFGCVVLHELGHALTSMHAGIPAKAIILLPIGGVTLLDETRQPILPGMLTWKRDIRIALAGPLVNLAIAFVSGSILLAVAPEIGLWKQPFVTSLNLPRSLVWGNAWLALFNLLPAYPMDGGRVLRAVFSRRMDPVQRHAPRRVGGPGLCHSVHACRACCGTSG